MLQSTVTDGEAQPETTYYFYGRGLLAQENKTGGYLTYHFNNVGSTMAVTDSKGGIRETYNYTPYGELIEGTYDENIPFLYNGQFGVTTDANGLYYMRARYYNVDIKRFINQDVLTGTLERISSLNRYAYVEGNPVSFLDPFGLDRYDTTLLHDIVTVINAIGGILTFFPATSAAGEIITLISGCVDICFYLYDLSFAIEDGDVNEAGEIISKIFLDLLSIIPTSISLSLKNSFKQADSFRGIIEGYTMQLEYKLKASDYFGTRITIATLVETVVLTLLER